MESDSVGKANPIQIGRTFSRYHILRKIGEGGMGEVFLAHDTTLDRNVALKFLPEESQDDVLAKGRFLSEAKAAAAIDHPYICKVYEAGECDGIAFISMEYVEGRTLVNGIEKSQSQPLAEILRVACEIAEALTKAHERGVIHRDLKPQNIIVTEEGHIKVMDFGLAKRVQPQGSGSLPTVDREDTLQGLVVGTVGYMSPEQVRGIRLDTRSDLFSLGVVLYEMLTGVHPFRRGTPIATLIAIGTEKPAPIDDLRPNCPDALQDIFDRLLEVERRLRYQSAGDVLSDLRGLLAGQPGTPAKHADRMAAVEPGSLAVLPFLNMSSTEENEYFSDGVTEELIAQVSRIRELRVISRTSAMRYKNSGKSIEAIARELGVAAVLEGSVRCEGSRVRIVAKLIDVQRDRPVWSEIYDRDLTDIFAVQIEVTEQIAAALSANLSATEAKRLREQGPGNRESYTTYLKGRYFSNKLVPEEIKRGISYFGRALNLDPTYGRAYAGLATSYATSGHLGFLPTHEAFPKAKAAAKMALDLDPTLAEAHAAIAFVAMLYEWDWAAAEQGFKKAVGLNPSNGETHVYYSWYFQAMNDLNSALAEAEEALVVDPLSVTANMNLGHMLTMSERYDAAIEQLHKTLEIDANAWYANYGIGMALIGKGRYQEVIELLGRDEAKLVGSGQLVLAWAYALGGRSQSAREMVESVTESSNRQGVSAALIALTYLMLGNEDASAEWLQRAYEERDSQFMNVKSWPWARPYQSNPKLVEVCRRIGLSD